jgi:signal transduction histidine kinase
MAAVVRGLTALFWGVLATLLAFGLVADRALVGQASAAREKAVAQADESARRVALSIRAALAQIEEGVAGGQTPAGVTSERLAAPPPNALPFLPFVPYPSRSREELSRLLSSQGWTPSGLPEAVVARLILGEEPAVSGAGEAPRVAERLLDGRIPVRPEDLPELARRLGVGSDPRVAALEGRLASLPREIPAAPTFRRRVAGEGVEGWSRASSTILRYEVALGRMLDQAGGDGTVVPAAVDEAPSQDGPTRRVAVPDVDGLVLAVTTEVPGALRIAVLRIALLLCVVSAVAGLVAARRAVERESRAVARERAFLSNVTHELRTPLAAIRLFGETLAEGRGEPREYGGLVAQESERLSDLVERVLAATRVDESPSFAPVRPAALVRSAVDLVAGRAERRHARVEMTAGDGLPEVLWDAEAVRHAVLNLLDNAVKHGREGGRVTVSVEAADGRVRIAVADDGPGIGRAHREDVFERFRRGVTTASGAGLGLHLVDQVVRAHGGTVDLATEEGKGATFTLVLPVAPPGAERAR